MPEQSENDDEKPTIGSSDELLMSLFKKGDEQAFRSLFDRHHLHVLNFAHRFLGSREEAEDICQEVFLRVYDKKDRFNSDRFFRPWMFTIASRLITNKLRHRKRHPAQSLDWKPNEDGEFSAPIEMADSTALQPVEILEKRQAIEMVTKALEALPEKQRVVVVLSRYENMPYEEIAMTMGISVGTVKSLVFRAKERLKELMSPLFSREYEDVSPITFNDRS